jgi:hypothetical protein
MRETARAAANREASSEWFTASLLVSDEFEPEDAEHIASWHPAVALAVADWLDQHARNHDPVEVEAGRALPCGWLENPRRGLDSCRGFAAACAYLDGARRRPVNRLSREALAQRIEAERPPVDLDAHPTGDESLVPDIIRRRALNDAARIVRETRP